MGSVIKGGNTVRHKTRLIYTLVLCAWAFIPSPYLLVVVFFFFFSFFSVCLFCHAVYLNCSDQICVSMQLFRFPEYLHWFLWQWSCIGRNMSRVTKSLSKRNLFESPEFPRGTYWVQHSTTVPGVMETCPYWLALMHGRCERERSGAHTGFLFHKPQYKWSI